MAAETTDTNILSGKKKFLAYVIGSAMLLVFALLFRPDPKLTLSVLAIINGGYWGAEGGVDIARAIFQAIAQRNGK